MNYTCWFRRECVTVPFAILGYKTANEHCLQFAVYLFGIRVAMFDKYIP